VFLFLASKGICYNSYFKVIQLLNATRLIEKNSSTLSVGVSDYPLLEEVKTLIESFGSGVINKFWFLTQKVKACTQLDWV
jgi:NCAIR mutase (PurE)-related protein